MTGLVGATVNVVKRHLVPLFAASALVITLAYLGWVSALAALGALEQNAEIPTWVSLAGSALNGAAYLGVLGISALVVLRDDDDPPPRAGELIGSMFKALPRLLVAGFITGSVMFIVGVVLTVGPLGSNPIVGLISLMAILALLGLAVFIVPALVLEQRSSLDAIVRSIQLARSRFSVAVTVALYAFAFHLLVSLIAWFLVSPSSRIAGLAWAILWALGTWPVQGVLAAEGFRQVTAVVAQEEAAIT